jgi:macrolide transport system ATP-binding/permease protein
VLTIEAINLGKSFGDRLLFKVDQPLKLYRGDRLGIVGANGAGKTTLLQLLSGTLEPDAGTIKRYGTIAVVAQWEAEEGDWSGGEKTRQRLAAAFALQADVLFADEPTSHLDMNGIMEVEKMLGSYPGTVVLISHDRELLDSVCTRILEVDNGRLTMHTGNYSQYREFKDNERDRAWLDYDIYVAKKEQLTEAITEKKKRASRAVKTTNRLGSSEARMGKDYYEGKAAKMEKNAKAIKRRLEKLEVVEKPRELPAVRFDVQAYVPIHGKAAIRLTDLKRIVPMRCDGSLRGPSPEASTAVSGSSVTSAGIPDTGTARGIAARFLRTDGLQSTYRPVGAEDEPQSRTLFRDLSLTIRPGAKVALLGPNGSGKSTLLRMIAEGAEGVRTAGSSRIGYFHQQFQLLNDDDTILDNVMSTSIHPESTVRTVLARLLFRREDVFKQIRLLSGGERVKVALAKLFLSDCNLLLLDEPTNYLDLPAKEEMEKVLKDYPGTILFATHDRRFAAQLADQVLSLDGGRYAWYDGSYGEYVQSVNDSVKAKQTVGNGGRAQEAKPAKADEEELMRLELERNTILARLSMPGKHNDTVELDRRFKDLTEQIKRLKI